MTNPAGYVLEKSVWTEADFDAMGWHDSFVHALAFRPDTSGEFLLDIDYILKWVEPGDDGYYSFWVAPATLVFWNVWDMLIDLGPDEGITILELNRELVGAPRNAAYIGKSEEWRWTIDSTAGEVTFRAVGYKQYIRRAPLLQKQQALSLSDRGGYSFDRPERHSA